MCLYLSFYLKEMSMAAAQAVVAEYGSGSHLRPEQRGAESRNQITAGEPKGVPKHYI